MREKNTDFQRGLGAFIQEHRYRLKDFFQEKLEGLRKEVYVSVNYQFKLTNGRIDDLYTLDVEFEEENEDLTTLTFTFKSIETQIEGVLEDLVRVISDTVKDPHSYRQSLYKAGTIRLITLDFEDEGKYSQHSLDLED